MFRCLAIIVAFFITTSLAAATERSIVVLDASGSMWGQIDGKSKIEIARDTLSTVLQSMPADRQVGLIAYGHREKGRCDDIELLIPAGSGTAAAIAEAANRLNPKGKTPLSASVRQAAQALRYTEDKASVILITDGLETCGADPCALGLELESSGVDFAVQVVGFGLSEEQGRRVACLAENTGGKYFQARDAAELGQALQETVVVPARKEPTLAANLKAGATLSADGEWLDDRDIRWDLWRLGTDGEPDGRPDTGFGPTRNGHHAPGRYRLRARLGAASASVDIELSSDRLTEVSLNLDAGYLTLIGRRAAGAEPDPEIRWDVALPVGKDLTNYGGKLTFVVPAGNRQVRARLGKASVQEQIQVAAGDRLTKDLIVASGRLVAYARYAADGPLIDKDVRFDVFDAADTSARRKAIASGYNYGTRVSDNVAFDLPPGKYILRAGYGEAASELPVAVRGNERVESQVVLNAGVLAISAPTANRIDILYPEKDISGRHKKLEDNYGQSWQTVVPAGDYVIRVRRKDRSENEGKVRVTAGQRSEITVE